MAGPDSWRVPARAGRAERPGCAAQTPQVLIEADRENAVRDAKDLIEYALWALKADVTIMSVQDPQTFGGLLYGRAPRAAPG